MDLTAKILDLSECYRRISSVFPYFPRLDFDFEGWYGECVRRAAAEKPVLLVTHDEADAAELDAGLLRL